MKGVAGRGGGTISIHGWTLRFLSRLHSLFIQLQEFTCPVANLIGGVVHVVGSGDGWRSQEDKTSGGLPASRAVAPREFTHRLSPQVKAPPSHMVVEIISKGYYSQEKHAWGLYSPF